MHEIMEALFGHGSFFDIQDNIRYVTKNQLDVKAIKDQHMEDFKAEKSLETS